MRIIRGDGSLFWAKGMRKAWEAAIAERDNWDGFLWLNDDTELDGGALQKLLVANDGQKIVVGDYLDSTERAPLIKEIGSRPSSGAFIVNRLRRVEGVSVDLYGFAFLEDRPRTSNDGFEHYSKDVSADYSKKMIAIGNHNIEREVEWFKRHVSGRRLILQ